MVDWSMGISDPLRSQAHGLDYANQIYNMQAQRKAGRAVAAGDYQGGAEALGNAGDVEGAFKLRKFPDDQKNEAIDRKINMVKAQGEYMKRAVPVLSHIYSTVGPEEALNAFDQIAPEMQQLGVTPEQITQFKQAFVKDPNGFLQALGAVVADDYEYRSAGDDVVVISKRTGKEVSRIKGTPKASDAARAPTTDTYNAGGEEVTREWDASANGGKGGWKEIARAPRYKPVDPNGGVDQRRQQTMAVQLRKEFDQLPDVKQFNEVANAVEIVQQLASSKSAADDVGLIFSFMKTLDPNSVVRETEFATAQNAAGIPDQIRNMYNRALSGNRLNDTQRKQFVSTVRSVYDSRKRRYDQLVRQYQGYARDSGLGESTISARSPISAPAPQAGSGVPFANAPPYQPGGSDTDALVNKYLGQ